jgi:hypothetical protein
LKRKPIGDDSRNIGEAHDTTLNVYAQVIDGALRTAVDKVGSELFTIVHRPAGSPELIH